MKSIVRWAVDNTPAINVALIALLAAGTWCMASMQREFWPYFVLDEIEIRVAYPGASPEDIEEAICEKIEAAVASIYGIDEINATASEGSGSVRLVLNSGVSQSDVQQILGDVRAAVDQIPSFPLLAEAPVISQRIPSSTAIQIGLIGPDSDSIESAIELRRTAERVRDELLRLASISQVELLGVPEFQIDVELREETLRQYGLTLSDVAQIIREENVEIPGGTLRSASQEILLRGSNRSNIGSEIARLPIINTPGGLTLRLNELGTVRDAFSDATAISRINGHPGIAISVNTTQSEDLLEVGRDVYAYLDSAKLPDGYSMVAYRDRSDDVRDRLSLMIKNGWQGLVLVFILLALFLEMRLAFWVAMGIPIAVCGAGFVMYFTGQTLNLTSLFAFLIALGIVVDDAIVVGENIYVHRSLGKEYRQAAIDGTLEVMPSVVVSVSTTVIAFLPLMFVTGQLGRFTTVLPIAVIAMLIVSLVESVTVLPSHLAHENNLFLKIIDWLLTPLHFLAVVFESLNKRVSAVLDAFIERVYLPMLSRSLSNPALVIASAVGLLVVSSAIVRSGRVPFVVLPRVDSNVLSVLIAYPNGTPASVTDKATKRIESALAAVNQELAEQGMSDREDGVIYAMHRAVGFGASATGDVSSGSHVGSVTVSLIDSGMRKVSSKDIINLWRKRAGEFPGTDVLVFGTGPQGPAAAPIEVTLLAGSDDIAELQNAVALTSSQLGEYPGVFDVTAGSKPGKYEYRLKIKDQARSMGVSLAGLSQTVRAAYYGDEVMRLQRDRHEVELRVRYPSDQRDSLADFRQIRHRTVDGHVFPITELADIEVARTDSLIYRTDQMRAITVSADIDEEQANAMNIVNDLKESFVPQLAQQFPNVNVRWRGQQEQADESKWSIILGFVLVIGAMYLLLTIEFKSYIQPILVLSIIPFGFIGAIAGHLWMQLPLTLFSIYGLIALSGIVVNDSIVLIDFINMRLRDGLSIQNAVLDAGRRRFRPVILTSITTIAGVLPILLETQRQALVLIPMATSLAFGLMFATAVVLILVPTFFFLIQHSIRIVPAA
ncbi:Toluene efflux pump membrane transporter TtgH [Rubripirellula tenax]|uniref:Toluene efflux pump membrane transporter TtgH n=1 Tax=Rubripirellula tenax TaxID=2528015 RepID=A0A5C6E525_9BACT|nr:efflux RND transporter permease subunit [Rubripirellula tenax]TWU44783.1 Toluene efflux pump membrane transporter TtgH [Rubripirellula tenax]